MGSSLPALIGARLRQPSKVFLRSSDGRAVTYEALWNLAGRFAHVLRAEGSLPGERVCVQVEKSPEVLALFLACARAGAVFLPLNTAYTLNELDYFLADAEPRILIVDPERASAVAELAQARGARLLTMGTAGDGSLAERASIHRPDFNDVPARASDIAALLYTSGTTGHSKGAMLTHENLTSNALALIDTWRIVPDDVLLHALPVFHVHGLFTATLPLLLAGGSMLFESAFDAGRALALLPRATLMMGVPTFYTRLLGHQGLTRDSTRHMRLFVSGSAPLLAETHRAFEARTGHAILERYGMTETGMIASNPYEGPRVPGSVGRPLPGVEVRISDRASGTVLDAGAIGMIEVRGPNVFKGYWRNREKTAAEKRPDGFFITGDLGRVDPDGYVTIVGRGKDVVISGGLNVYPKEVESEIDAIDGVAESAVFGVPHPDLGEGVTAAVVPKPGARLDEGIIRSALGERLAKFKLPKRVLIVAELPRNAMGKVQKAVLRQTYEDVYR